MSNQNASDREKESGAPGSCCIIVGESESAAMEMAIASMEIARSDFRACDLAHGAPASAVVDSGNELDSAWLESVWVT